jgi:predicted AlkP superfamily pyrophosphatase or phosphodiesterase
LALPAQAQQPKQNSSTAKPKLVVGIVVDQMRNDYIYRYYERFGEGGFKRLVENGYYFKNTHYNYIPTFTGPGHSSIYTGTTPRYHGIIANDWHIKGTQKDMYCAEDSSVQSVGANTKNGKMSPLHQKSSTIGDELKMNSNHQSKVFAVAIKDRSAVLPAGHAADAAFWYDDEGGNFITSTWYLNQLPPWLEKFNNEKKVWQYLNQTWSPLYPLNTYSNSIADLNNYEAVPNKKETATFNYEYKNYVEKKSAGILKATPFGNSLTTDIAIACIVNEKLGKDNVCDLFCLSYSSPDIIAHAYGPRSVEMEDVYLRLDKDIARLLNTLDSAVGKNNYTVFLTADHGGADVPMHLKDNKIPAGYMKENKLAKELKKYLFGMYGDSTLLENISNEQIFLNEEKIAALKIDQDLCEANICKFLIGKKGIAQAYPSRVLMNEAFTGNEYRALLQNGYNCKLSGHVAFMYEPGYMDYAEKGTTHGSGYNYDTHVPLLFYGCGIPKGFSHQYIAITQVAVTVCELLQINQPNASTAQPLNDYFRIK